MLLLLLLLFFFSNPRHFRHNSCKSSRILMKSFSAVPCDHGLHPGPLCTHEGVLSGHGEHHLPLQHHPLDRFENFFHYSDPVIVQMILTSSVTNLREKERQEEKQSSFVYKSLGTGNGKLTCDLIECLKRENLVAGFLSASSSLLSAAI